MIPKVFPSLILWFFESVITPVCCSEHRFGHVCILDSLLEVLFLTTKVGALLLCDGPPEVPHIVKRILFGNLTQETANNSREKIHLNFFKSK